MRTITFTKDLYSYSELSDAAQEKVREKISRWGWEDGSMNESMQLIADGMLEDLGFSEAENLTYSLSTQGGYPAFGTSGTFEHEGTEYTLTVTNSRANFEIEILDVDSDYLENSREAVQAIYKAARDFLSDLSYKMFRAFVAEDEYRSSDEEVRETAEANEWEFDEFGNFS